MQQFSDFIHEVADNLPCGHEVLPSTGTVFDYYLDLKTYRFFSWSEKKREKSANATSKYISIPEVSQCGPGLGMGLGVRLSEHLIISPLVLIQTLI